MNTTHGPSRMLKKVANRLLTRAAQNCAHLFAATYRAATVRERSRRTLFQKPARLPDGGAEFGRGPTR